MDDVAVKLAIYRHFAVHGARPAPADIALGLSCAPEDVLAAYQRLRAARVLVLEADGASIRMAPPFSGVPTQHVVQTHAQRYYANCAWDALGIPAALAVEATVHSRCEPSLEPLLLEVTRSGPAPSDWLFHCVVPAAHWWDDIVFT